jgi:hypothetical protein
MAEPKIKVEENRLAHDVVRSVRMTITTMPRHWQALYPSSENVYTGDQLREADSAFDLTQDG